MGYIPVMKNDLTSQELRYYVTYDPDTGSFIRNRPHHRWKAGTAMKGSTDRHGHIRITIARQVYAAHRLAVLYMTGEWPPHDVDHINGVRNDNRWSNLRLATRAENLWNSRDKPNKTGFRGVHKHGPNYRARLRVKYRTILLGPFPTAEAAHAAYLKAVVEHHGQFAR